MTKTHEYVKNQYVSCPVFSLLCNGQLPSHFLAFLYMAMPYLRSQIIRISVGKGRQRTHVLPKIRNLVTRSHVEQLSSELKQPLEKQNGKQFNYAMQKKDHFKTLSLKDLESGVHQQLAKKSWKLTLWLNFLLQFSGI